jgi:hypothetical protein
VSPWITAASCRRNGQRDARRRQQQTYRDQVSSIAGFEMNKVALDCDRFPVVAEKCAPMIVAIPANNEAERVETCLAALAAQREGRGRPLPNGAFEIIIFANNCSDGTAEIASAMARVSAHPISVV